MATLCTICDSLFQQARSWQKFCSSCRSKYGNHPAREVKKRAQEAIQCGYCEDFFIPSIKNRKYCTKHKKTIACTVYSNKHPERIKEYQKIYREKNIEKCRERTRLCEEKRRNRIRFNNMRYIILKRDNYTCQSCRKDVSEKFKAVIHHKDRNKSNNIASNLETLCRECHSRYHYFLGHYPIDGAPISS